MNLRYLKILDWLLLNLKNTILKNTKNTTWLSKNTTTNFFQKHHLSIIIKSILCYIYPKILSEKKKYIKMALFFYYRIYRNRKVIYCIIHFLINLLKNVYLNYFLIAPTDIAIQNIGKNTIHSELRIVIIQIEFQTLIIYDDQLKQKLKKVNTIIIEEISIVSKELLKFILNILIIIHENTLTFEGISIVIIRNLA